LLAPKQILLATPYITIQLKKREFEMRVKDVVGGLCWDLLEMVVDMEVKDSPHSPDLALSGARSICEDVLDLGGGSFRTGT
jgi:hypothetical protein